MPSNTITFFTLIQTHFFWNEDFLWNADNADINNADFLWNADDTDIHNAD